MVENIPRSSTPAQMKVSPREVALDVRGLLYVRKSLAAGKELSRGLSRCLDLDRGSVSTFLPANVPENEIYEFEWGGKLPVLEPPIDLGQGFAVPIPNLDELLIEIIRSHLNSGTTSFCLLEDPISTSGDYLPNHLVPVKTLGQSAFVLLSQAQADPQLIREALKDTSSLAPPTVGALGRWRLDTPPALERELDEQDVTAFAEATERFFVRAYDGEGFLLWSRTTRH
jgi:hypothetical protein